MDSMYAGDRNSERQFVRTALQATGALASVGILVAVLSAGDAGALGNRACTHTAHVQHQACRAEVWDDYFTARAICINESERPERWECFRGAREERIEEMELCADQREARIELCEKVGEERYDPECDPEDFDTDFTDLSNPNPYYPLTIGNSWVYQADGESNTVEVQDRTKLIEGLTCVVVRDFVTADDGASEDTDDWLAHNLDGSVHYCGEEAKDYQTFAGDDPMLPELVEIEGSFKKGRDGDKSGVLFPGNPEVGQTFRQEWSAGNAEDWGMIVSTDYGYGNDPELDECVPEELAELLCDDDCVVVQEGTPIEPGVLELKYYARDVGGFLEAKVEDGECEINQLVSCNVDPRCDALPEPEDDEE